MYEKAKVEYPNPVEEIPIPEGREAEEDLGPIADDSPPNGALDGDGVFDVEVREDDEAEVAEDPRELLEEDGPEEEIADEPVLAVEPRKKRQKRTSVLPADNGSNSTINVSRSGRTLNPSTLHGGIQPNRYSTVA